MVDFDELVKSLGQLSLIDATNLVKRLEDEWGVSSKIPASELINLTTIDMDDLVEKQTEFDVVINSYGSKKIEVIKEVRRITRFGLMESKALAETVGGKILESVEKDVAEDALSRLKNVGAEVYIV